MNENMNTNEEKIYLAHSKKLKVHIILKDKTWRNGFVKKIKPDFFIFIDEVNGEEPLFFLEVHDVQPYMEGVGK